MLKNNEKLFVVVENRSERYFLPTLLNFYKTLHFTHIKATNSQKAKRDIPVYDLDENKCLFVSNV